MTLIEVDDLAPFADIDPAKAQAMIQHVLAQAFAPDVAPCLSTTEDEATLAAARSVLVGVVLRWHEMGTASYAAQSAGPPGYPADTTRERRNMLWPSEEDKLRSLCGAPLAGSVRMGWLS